MILDEILSIDTKENVEEQLSAIFRNYTEKEQVILTASKALSAFIRKMNIQNSEYVSFWKYLRKKIIIVAETNIRKISNILNDHPQFEESSLKDAYIKIDFIKLLIKQNESSNASIENNRFIWVLNTFITILGEYKFFWMDNM